MAGLGLAKGRVARRIGNAVLEAEARFSMVDASLSAAVLLGLVTDRAVGWWWADPVAALLVAGWAGWEGVERFRPWTGRVLPGGARR